MKKILYILPAVFLFSACTPNISPDVYSVESAGKAGKVVPGVVIAARPVAVEGTNKIGAATGAIAGGAGGSAIGGGTRANIIGAVGGALIGGIVGGMTEKAITGQQGMEYIVEVSSGQMITVTQSAEPAFAEGQKILVLYGNPVRIIADNRQNPGAAPATQRPAPKPSEQQQQ